MVLTRLKQIDSKQAHFRMNFKVIDYQIGSWLIGFCFKNWGFNHHDDNLFLIQDGWGRKDFKPCSIEGDTSCVPYEICVSRPIKLWSPAPANVIDCELIAKK